MRRIILYGILMFFIHSNNIPNSFDRNQKIVSVTIWFEPCEKGDQFFTTHTIVDSVIYHDSILFEDYSEKHPWRSGVYNYGSSDFFQSLNTLVGSGLLSNTKGFCNFEIVFDNDVWEVKSFRNRIDFNTFLASQKEINSEREEMGMLIDKLIDIHEFCN